MKVIIHLKIVMIPVEHVQELVIVILIIVTLVNQVMHLSIIEEIIVILTQKIMMDIIKMKMITHGKNVMIPVENASNLVIQQIITVTNVKMDIILSITEQDIVLDQPINVKIVI